MSKKKIYVRLLKRIYIPENWLIAEYENLDEFLGMYKNTKDNKYALCDGYYYAFDYDAHVVMCCKLKGD